MSMTEILVSIFILSLALISFDKLELYSLTLNQNASYLTIACNQMDSITERLRALKNNDGLENQIDNWNLQNKIFLPKSTGYVTGVYPNYSIKLCWSSHCLQEAVSL